LTRGVRAYFQGLKEHTGSESQAVRLVILTIVRQTAHKLRAQWSA
jgi:hypothetical protein